MDEQPRGSLSSDTRGPENIDPLFGDDDIPVDYESGYDSLPEEEAPSPILSMTEMRARQQQDEVIPEKEDGFDPFLPHQEEELPGDSFAGYHSEEEMACFSDGEGSVDINNTSLALGEDDEGQVQDPWLIQNLANNRLICRAIAPWTTLVYPEGVRREDRDTTTTLYSGNRYYVKDGRQVERDSVTEITAHQLIIVSIRDMSHHVWTRRPVNETLVLARLLEAFAQQWEHTTKMAGHAPHLLRKAKQAIDNVLQIIQRLRAGLQGEVYTHLKMINNIPKNIRGYLQRKHAELAERYGDFRDMEKEPHNSSHGFNSKPPSIPTTETFSWSKERDNPVLTYMRNCINTGHSPKPFLFSRQLQEEFHALMRANSTESELRKADYDSTAWMQFSAAQFITWIEDLTEKRNLGKGAPADGLSQFRALIRSHHLISKIADMDRNDQSSLDKVCLKLKLAYQRLLQRQSISVDTERDLAKGIFHHFEVMADSDIQGATATDAARAQVKAHLLRIFAVSTKIYEVLPLIEGIQWVMNDIATKRRVFMPFINMGGAGRSNQDHPKKDNKASSKKDSGSSSSYSSSNSSSSGSSSSSTKPASTSSNICRGCGYTLKPDGNKKICPATNDKDVRTTYGETKAPSHGRNPMSAASGKERATNAFRPT